MEKKEIVRKGYNKVAKKIQEIDGLEKDGLDEWKPFSEFMDRVPLGGLVLDAGCGNGSYSCYLNKKCDVIGVDISEKQIELAKQNALKGKFICMDMTRLEFPNEFFDGILSYYSIIHIPRDEHYDLLKNFYRMLKIHGVCLLTFHINNDPESYAEDFFGSGSLMYWSGFDKDFNIKMLRNIGFKIIWSKLIKESSTFGEDFHLFVFVEK
ncbi:MAG: class I SAM-dependent methyltransferase [Promethearchaeota archaeon]